MLQVAIMALLACVDGGLSSVDGARAASGGRRAQQSDARPQRREVFAFGSGSAGRLGLGSTGEQLSPVQIASLGSDNALIAAGGSHSLVLRTDGTVF
eukprot:COSAG02_NODE_22473_length_751_cov_1.552147_1_plen_96_part_10